MRFVQQDISGQRFGLLVAKEFSHRTTRRSKHYFWKCLCDCGETALVDAGNLKSGNSRSCGCERKRRTIEAKTTHGHTRGGIETAEFTTWKSMVQRCRDPNTKSYRHYGGRGITVCARWAASFEAFLEDMGPKPSPDHSIERERVNEGYSPENCKWATRSEQARNRRDRATIIIDGIETSLADKCDELSLPYHTIWQRINRLNWSAEKALTEPIRGRA